MSDEIGCSTDAGQAAAQRYGERDRALAVWQRNVRRQPTRPAAAQERTAESDGESSRDRTGGRSLATAHAETD
jgi:hypothetical protein